MLAHALADGRLTIEEHSERTDAALTARTLGELAVLTRDLASPAQQPLQVEGGQVVSAVFGEAVLDLREALLQDRHVVLNVYALCGRVRLIVPAGVEVVMNGTEIVGRQRGGTARLVPADSNVPVVEVRGYLVMSEVLVRTPPRPRRWLPRRRRALP